MYLYTYCKFIYMYICICHIFTCLCISMYHQIRVCYIHIHICTHFLCCAGLSKRPVRKRSARCGPLGEWLRRPSQSSLKRTFRRRSLPEFRFVHVARAHPCLFLASFSISIVAYADACSCPMWWLMDWSNLFYTIGKGKLEIQEYGGAGFTGSYSVCNRDGVVVEDDLGNTTKICQVRDFCWAWGAALVLSLMTYAPQALVLSLMTYSIMSVELWRLRSSTCTLLDDIFNPSCYTSMFNLFPSVRTKARSIDHERWALTSQQIHSVLLNISVPDPRQQKTGHSRKCGLQLQKRRIGYFCSWWRNCRHSSAGWNSLYYQPQIDCIPIPPGTITVCML